MKGEQRPNANEVSMWLGKEMEPILKTWYLLQYPDHKLRRNSRTFRHPTEPLCMGTPDGFISAPDRGPGIAEFKTVWSYEECRMWGQTGDLVPPMYLAQITWYMGLTGRKWCALIALIAPERGDKKLQIYHINFSPSLFHGLLYGGKHFMGARAWWEKYVVTKTMPPPGGEQGDRWVLNELYPQDDTPIAPANNLARDLLIELRGAEAERKEKQREESRIKQEIMAEVKTAQGVESRDAKATWKVNKAGNRVFRVHFRGKEA